MQFTPLKPIVSCLYAIVVLINSFIKPHAMGNSNEHSINVERTHTIYYRVVYERYMI